MRTSTEPELQTERWIELLASRAEPVGSRRTWPLIGRLLPWGLAASFALMLAAYGPRPDLVEVAALPMFWLKAGAPLAIADNPTLKD